MKETLRAMGRELAFLAIYFLLLISGACVLLIVIGLTLVGRSPAPDDRPNSLPRRPR